MPRDLVFDDDDDGLPETDARGRISELSKGSPVTELPTYRPRPPSRYAMATAHALTELEREAEKGLRTGISVSWRRSGDYEGHKPKPKELPKFLTTASIKLDPPTKAKWESVMTGIPFKTVGGELVCAKCGANQYDCKCDPNPWVARAMANDPLVQKFGLARNGHPHFSGSAAAGFLNCDAYVLVNAALPDKTSEYAAYGTVCHKVSSDFLESPKSRMSAWEKYWDQYCLPIEGAVTEQEGYEIKADQILLTAAKTYVACCLRDIQPGDQILTERKVWYSRYLPIPNQGGTLDFAILRWQWCGIRDAKFGEGVKVFATKNEQLLTYAVGVMEEYDWLYDFQTFDFVISQPRMDHEDPWSCTRQDVLDHAERLRAAGLRNWKEGARRTPGAKQCRWCADKLCPAKTAQAAAMMAGAFDVEGFEPDFLERSVKRMEEPLFDGHESAVEPVELSTTALAQLKKFRPVIDGFFKAAEEELLLRARKGQDIPFFNHVPGRATNKWIDEVKAAIRLKRLGLADADIFVTELISNKKARDALRAMGLKPADIKKHLFEGKHPVAEHVPGKTTLAPIEEGRVGYASEMASGFDSEDADADEL